MTQSSYHSSGTPTLIVVQNNGTALVNIKADAITHALQISDGTTGSDNGPTVSFHDTNNVAVLMATSNTDGKTPVVVYGDSSGNLLIDSM